MHLENLVLQIGDVDLAAGGFDFDVYASRQAQLVQGFDRASGRLQDINNPFVGANLELVTRLLIYKGSGKNRVAFDARWQWNRAMNLRVGPLGRFDDLGGTLVQNRMVIRFHTNSDNFFRTCGHVVSTFDFTTIKP